ncbi:MAG: TonB-dependent receptor [Flavobacteriaceae bacterium]|nr:TonB-dependent receptor [Flavobacteriaceae bacterium]
MRKIVFTLPFLLLSSSLFSQEKDPTKVKDSIKTEIINVVTSYTPTISDAFKIKRNPSIKLGAKIQKRKLQYQIFSAPVASTFIPKTGIVKGMSMGKKERLYNNYIAAGFGNNSTPFFEAFLHRATRFKNDFGLYAKYISSKDGVQSTPLNNEFSNLVLGAFYKQEERSFLWKVGADYTRDQYNWYGLPSSITFTDNVINAIDENLTYSNFDTHGEITFEDNIVKTVKASLSFFSDDNSSKELRFVVQPQFQISLKSLGRKFNDLIVDSSLDYLNGDFTQSYSSTTKLEHSFFTLGVAPKYSFKHNDFTIKLGTKIYFSSDLENQNNKFYIYPDINISYPILENSVNFYIGATGDLNTNTYKEFTSENPYVSPTLTLKQSNQKYKVFGGFNGKFSTNISYDIKASYSDVEDKALFIRNNSKTNGIRAIDLVGYEYGNSFSVLYDDVKTLSIFAELSMDLSKNLVIGANGQFNSYTMTNQIEAWNSPKMTAEVFGNYAVEKWYAGANLFVVGERKDVIYATIFPSSPNSVQTLKSYVDLNLNGGYHINDRFTAFLKLNNVFNSEYQRFANFTVQGFQVLAGVSYKFDF